MSFHPNDVVRRGRTASLLLCGALVFLLSAFFRNQILRNDPWMQQSERNRLRLLPIPAPRGAILDRNGKVIAESAVAYAVSFLATSEDTLRATLARLDSLVPIKAKEYEDAIKRFRRDKGRPTIIFPDASFDKVSVLEEHRPDFPNLVIQATPKRFYPHGAAVGAFIGYINEVNERELATMADSGYRPGHQIGKQGLELRYEGVLRGREGASFVEVDAHSRVVSGEVARPGLKPVPGQPLKTSIDIDLQLFIHNLFSDTLMGAVVAIEPKTGDILALHSLPNVDPNRWIGGMAPSLYDSLLADPKRPLVNKAIYGTYPPGSTFKLATAVIALQEGVVKMTDRMPTPCVGGYQFGNRFWKCWDKNGHGFVDLTGAIAKSCDVYFYQLGQRIGISRLVAGGVQMGFFARTGVDIPNEQRPLYPNEPIQAYYDRQIGAGRWTAASEVLNLSIGQGANSQTVINMARFFAGLANRGLAPTPRFVGDKPELKQIFSLTEQQMNDINHSLVTVVSGAGTAGASAIEGVAFAGKTGTAQTGVYSPAGLELDHAWFTGYAPAENPRIAIAVFLEFGGGGSRAARIASSIVEAYLKQQVTPVEVTGE